MSNKKKKGILCTLYSLMGPKFAASLAKRAALSKKNISRFDFPGDIEKIKRAVIIMPDDTLQSLYHLNNIHRMILHFSKSEFSILLKESLVPWFKSFDIFKNIYTYADSENCPFSANMVRLRNELIEKKFSALFILNPEPSNMILHLVGSIHVPIRISYSNFIAYPFANLRINLTDKKSHISEGFLSMSSIVGAKPSGKLHWSVPRKFVEETDVILKEIGIGKETPLVVLDADLVFNNTKVSELPNINNIIVGIDSNINILFYISNQNNTQLLKWVKSMNYKVLFGYSPAKLAALLRRANLVVSGKSVIYELAYLLDKNRVVFFHSDDVEKYGRSEEKEYCITFDSHITHDNIKEFADKITNYIV